MTVLLWLIVAISSLAAVEGALVRAHLLRRARSASRDIPIDDASGLFDHRVFDARVAGELKRLERMPEAEFWLSVWHVSRPDDADAFGRAAADALEFPAMGFRLDDTTFCFARITEHTDESQELLQRLTVASAAWPASVGVVQGRELVDELPRDLVERATPTSGAGEGA